MARASSALQKMGYRTIAVGGLVPLRTPEILAVLEAIAAVRKPHTKLHLFGVTRCDHFEQFANFGVAILTHGPGVAIQPPGSTVVTQTINYQLSFLVEPRPTEGFSLQSLSLTSPGNSNGSGSEGLPGGRMRVFIALPEPLPDHPIDIHINEATLAVLGTWQIEWIPPQGQNAP